MFMSGEELSDFVHSIREKCRKILEHYTSKFGGTQFQLINFLHAASLVGTGQSRFQGSDFGVSDTVLLSDDSPERYREKKCDRCS
jgi:hypothetical protein